MVEENDTDHNSTDADDGHNNSKSSYLSWVFIAGGIAVVGLLAASICWPNLTERTKFFTGNLLNLVIALAVIAQVLIYRKQWGAMRESIQRQEADLAQWIEMLPYGIRTETGSEAVPPDEVRITLRWRILNNTRLPLTLERIDISICREKDWEMFEIVESELIPPAGQDARNFYPFFVELDLTKGQTKDFLADGIGLSIATRVTWRDAIGKRREQSFGDLYDCAIHEMSVSERLGKSPTFVGIEAGDEDTQLVTSTVNVLGEFPAKDRTTK
jgi:hypothetical protein